MEDQAASSHFCAMPARYRKIERRKDKAKRENWARTSHAVMKPNSAPVDSGSDEPHRWLGQIKTQFKRTKL